MKEDKKKYNYMENVLQVINRMYISLPQREVRRNKIVLEQVVGQIIKKMKKDALFNALYTRKFYGGSFYDGLKVGHPEEFDLDLLLQLPEFADPELEGSNMPGFVRLRLNAMERFEKIPENQSYPGMAKLVDNRGYLRNSEVRAWIESILTKAVNDFKKKLGDYVIIYTSFGKVKAKVHKAGPAFTMKLRLESNKKRIGINMDIDLVPCFIFTEEYWPPHPYRENPVQHKPDFFIVPKPPTDNNNAEIYWRLSFQEQERVLIHNRLALKPVLKLLKKLRDQGGHDVVKSYYIKTIFLWVLEKHEELDEDFWRNSLSYVFVTMLEIYQKYIENGIPYYWYPKNKLLNGNYPSISNRLKAMIQDIKHSNDPFVVLKYFVPSDEIEDVKSLKQFRKLQRESFVQG